VPDIRQLIKEVSIMLHGKTLATAESCTGGLIGHYITNIPGSSSYYLGGVITYSSTLKNTILGVPEAVLKTHSAVSKETVSLMCGGLKKLTGADYGIAVSGIAGPDGGSSEKPVGLVYIGVVGSGTPLVTEHHFSGDRETIKTQVVLTAFLELKKTLV